MQQLVEAVSFLHRKGIALRNLNPENIIVNRNGKIKITDFTYATYTNEDWLCNDFFSNTVFSPPEMLKENEYKAKAVDVWALGVIFYEIMMKTHPWICNNKLGLAYAMETVPLQRNNRFSILQYDLLTKMLQPDMQRRFSIIQVENHLWLRKHDVDKEFRNSINKIETKEELINKHLNHED